MMMHRVWKFGVLTSAISGTLYITISKDDLYHTGVFRLGRAGLTVAKIAYDYKSSLHGMDNESKLFFQTKSEVHTRSALRLRDLACENGGCFIKVGQHLGSLDYLLPPEYVTVLKVLHKDAPKSPVEDLYPVITTDLKKEVDELFDDFEPEPLGAASLAQVHRARLKDGTTVAVKVQYPRVRAHSMVDMATMDVLVRVVAWLFPDFQFQWLAEETRKNLPQELDFLNEGRNCERVAQMFHDMAFLKVPKIYWELSSERILTMEFCEGGQVNDKAYFEKHVIDVNEVNEKLGELYSEMIFVQGYVHCDPHPGNVLVHKPPGLDTQLVLLDHGLYQSLTDEFRLNYVNLWMAIIEANVANIKLYAERMNCGHLYGLFACMLTARSWASVSSGLAKRKFTREEDTAISHEVGRLLPEIAEILRLVPRQMLLLLKTNDLLRGIECALGTRSSASSFLTMSKSCVRALANQQRRDCHTWLCRVGIATRQQWTVFKINIYKYYLYLTSFFSAFS